MITWRKIDHFDFLYFCISIAIEKTKLTTWFMIIGNWMRYFLICFSRVSGIGSAHIAYDHQDSRVMYACRWYKGLMPPLCNIFGSLLQEFAELPSKTQLLRAWPIFISLSSVAWNAWNPISFRVKIIHVPRMTDVSAICVWDKECGPYVTYSPHSNTYIGVANGKACTYIHKKGHV